MERTILDCPKPADLLASLLRHCPIGGAVACEGEMHALEALLADIPGAAVGLAPPFLPEWNSDPIAMIVVPVTAATLPVLLERLVRGGRVAPEVRALQIAFRDEVQFVAGDDFHPECLSVGPGYPAVLLRELRESGVLAGFCDREEAVRRIEAGQWSVNFAAAADDRWSGGHHSGT